MYIYNGQLFDINVPQTVGDVQYPAGWFADQANRDAHNITPMFETIPSYDPLSQVATQIAPTLVNGVWTQQWQISNIDASIAAQNLANAKVEKRLQINQWREQANSSYFTHAGKTFACNELSKWDIDLVAGNINLNGDFPASFPGKWKAIDNSFLDMSTVQQFKDFYASMTHQGALNFIHSETLKVTLNAATTQAEIDAVVW